MRYWYWLLLLFGCTAWCQPLIKVGGYAYAPMVVKDHNGQYQGLTLDLIRLLNEIQQDVHFVFVPTSAQHRHQALNIGRFSLMLFEDISWGWALDEVRITRTLLQDNEVYVALKAANRDQSFFDQLTQRQLIGVTGYHYGLTAFRGDPAELHKRFRITLVKDNISALQALFKGRGEVAIINLAYLDQFARQYPDQAARLLRAATPTYTYQLRALLSPTAGISPDQLEGWLTRLKTTGRLAPVWTKYGVQRYVTP